MKISGQIKPTVEDIIKALRICAVETPQEDYPCKDCYLYPLSRDGRMSTGRTCFEHLTMDTASTLEHLNNFSQSQAAKLLEKNCRLQAAIKQAISWLTPHPSDGSRAVERARKYLIEILED